MHIIRENPNSIVIVADEKGPGNANHIYDIQIRDGLTQRIIFQKGPIKEVGVNGCQNEDLLAVVIDRLQGFQKGDFSCRENAIALTLLETALLWMDKRTQDRISRGVEGKDLK